MALCDDIRELTERALWETENLIKCVPETLWGKRYDGLPMWKYLYHMLFSMDRWYINPEDPDYVPPAFHKPDLADLNVVPKDEFIDREELEAYFFRIREKLEAYLETLRDEELGENPPGCGMSRLKLIFGQIRHWHRHMGLVYGFLIQDTGKWPYVLNMQGKMPEEPMPNFYG